MTESKSERKIWRAGRGLKLLSLLSLFLPWMTVSCAGQTIGTASGWNVAFGRLAAHNPATAAPETFSGSPNLLICIALLGIVISLALGFSALPGKLAVVTATTVASTLCLWGGALQVTPFSLMESARQSPGLSQLADMSTQAVLHVEWRFGLWLCLVSTTAAAIIEGLAMKAKLETGAKSSP